MKEFLLQLWTNHKGKIIIGAVIIVVGLVSFIWGCSAGCAAK